MCSHVTYVHVLQIVQLSQCLIIVCCYSQTTCLQRCFVLFCTLVFANSCMPATNTANFFCQFFYSILFQDVWSHSGPLNLGMKNQFALANFFKMKIFLHKHKHFRSTVYSQLSWSQMHLLMVQLIYMHTHFALLCRMCCLQFWWHVTSLSPTSNPRNIISCPLVSKHTCTQYG